MENQTPPTPLASKIRAAIDALFPYRAILVLQRELEHARQELDYFRNKCDRLELLRDRTSQPVDAQRAPRVPRNNLTGIPVIGRRPYWPNVQAVETEKLRVAFEAKKKAAESAKESVAAKVATAVEEVAKTEVAS